MLYSENLFESELVARCRECDEPLYDGDTAYLIGGRYYCTGCVDDAFVVCRNKDDYSHDDDTDDEGYDE